MIENDALSIFPDFSVKTCAWINTDQLLLACNYMHKFKWLLSKKYRIVVFQLQTCTHIQYTVHSKLYYTEGVSIKYKQNKHTNTRNEVTLVADLAVFRPFPYYRQKPRIAVGQFAKMKRRRVLVYLCDLAWLRFGFGVLLRIDCIVWREGVKEGERVFD